MIYFRRGVIRMPSIVKSAAHSNRALEWYEKNAGNNSLFFALGKTSPWDSEGNPPIPVDENDIVEVKVYEKADAYFVVKDSSVSDDKVIYYRGDKYRRVDIEDVKEEKCRHILVVSEVGPGKEETTGFKYRQAALKVGVVVMGTQSESEYLPEDISKSGDTEVLMNFVAINRIYDKKERIAVLLEF